MRTSGLGGCILVALLFLTQCAPTAALSWRIYAGWWASLLMHPHPLVTVLSQPRLAAGPHAKF